MPLKLLNASLLIAAIVGGIFTYQAGQKHRRLLAEYYRLVNEVGDLEIGDPSKIHVRAIDTGEDLHFAWRVYLPAGFKANWKHNSGGTGSSWNSSPREFIARVRLLEDDGGRLRMFSKEDGGSGMFGFGNRELADLLRGRWDEIEVEQLGSDGIVVIKPDEVAVMLRLRLSDDLKHEAEEKLPKYMFKRFETEFFALRLGSDEAFEQAKAKTS